MMSVREDIIDIQTGLGVLKQRVRDLAVDSTEAARVSPILDAIIAVQATTNRVLYSLDRELSPTTVQRSDAPQSSVEIERMAKGLPKLVVKVYSEGAEDARDLAVSLYEETLAHFAEAAKVTESEATA